MFKRHIVTLILLLLLVCVGFAYWNVDKCGFSSFDDYKYVVTNFHVISGFTWANVTWAFSTFLASNWHPLTWLSHMLDCQVYGLKPAGHHLTNLLFHLLNTALLFLALKKMTRSRWKSALVAVLFGIHPLHVESVAWVSERKDVLSTTFLLLTILCYSSYVVSKKRRIYIGALILFAAGLMAKSMIVTLPFVLLLLDAWPLQRASWVKDNLLSTRSDSGNQWPGLIVEKVPFLILSAFSCAVTLAAQGGGGAMVSVQRLPVPIRLENAAISYVSYVGKMLWPANLSFFYPHAAVHPNVVLVLFSCAVILFVTVVAVVMRRKYPYFLVGWLWFLGTLVPVIGLVQVGSQAMADRYTYVPIVGLFVAVVWLLGDLATMHRIVRTAVVTLSICAVIVCALQTRVQAGYWENDLSLAEHSLSLTKGSSVAYSTKGLYLLSQHRLAEAHECFFQSLLCDSTRTTTRLNIGWIHLQQGKPEKAIPIFKEILSKDPHHALASLYCGMAYAKLGDLVTATHYYARAVGIDSSCVPALKSLGLAYGASGDFSRCRTFLLQAIRWSPDDAQTYFFMGICCHSAGNDTESVHWCLKAIARAPDVPESHELLGEVYNSLGRPDLARQQVSIARALMLRSPKEQK